MKRICFLVDSIFSIGGVQRVTAVIAKELSKVADVTIVTFDKPEAMNTTLYKLNEVNIYYRFFSYPHIGKIENTFCRAYSGFYQKCQPQSKLASALYGCSSFPYTIRKALIKELQSGHYDIIIGVHAPLAARLATIRHLFPNTELIGWLHNSYEALFGDTSLYIGAKRKRHYIYQFRKLNQVVVLCEDDADKFHDYDKAFSPIVIYNPLTLLPGKLSDGNTKRFLAIGRFTPLHKGFDLLIDAFHYFVEGDTEWCLDIVGEGIEEETYKTLINKYHLEDRVTIHPFTNTIQDYYSNAEVYVLSSRWEGMPLVLVEAMSHGLPIVTSDLPVCKEILGDCGLYFRNGNIQELAQRLEDATHIDWTEKSKEALEIARKFDVANIITQWKTLLDI